MDQPEALLDEGFNGRAALVVYFLSSVVNMGWVAVKKTALCSFVANTVFSPDILDQVQDPNHSCKRRKN